MKSLKLKLAVVLGLVSTQILAQRPTNTSNNLIYKTVLNGDTIGLVYMVPIVIRGDISEEMKAEFLGNKRLIRDLKKTMPFAKEMSKRIKIYDKTLDSLEKRSAEKKYIREESRKLKEDFEEDMKKLNLRQGKLLIKLVHRETGRSGYSLLSDYKGNGSAVFWNTFASIFGASLKKEYDRKEELEIEFLINHLGLDDQA